MNAAAELLEGLREQGCVLWKAGEQLQVDAPSELATAELSQRLREHKSEILTFLAQEAAEVPLVQARVVARSRTGVEVVEVQPINPPGPTRWEKRWSSRGVVSLLGDSTTDPARAACWVEVLRGLSGTVLEP